MFQVAGITFYWYGLIVGSAVALTVWWMEALWQQARKSEKRFWSALGWLLLGTLVGARLWHVGTDFHLYQNDLMAALMVWQGGLSILGAVAGGLMSALVLVYVDWLSWEEWRYLLDSFALTAPFGQAVGRWGNYFNQELYGSPSTLPWAITIEPTHRLAGYERVATYHPLFAYEMVLMLVLGGSLWWLKQRAHQLGIPELQLGSGLFFGWYVLVYALIRFGLDFIRLEKTLVPGLPLGWNQVILLIVMITLGSWLTMKWRTMRE
jgi:phosphatidylglycerol:prolipoprotein diacylglycerol transferase